MLSSQNDILRFPGHGVIGALLDFMTDEPSSSREVIGQGIKSWLEDNYGDFFKTNILFIDFALCQIEDASKKYFFIDNSDSSAKLNFARRSRAIVSPPSRRRSGKGGVGGKGAFFRPFFDFSAKNALKVIPLNKAYEKVITTIVNQGKGVAINFGFTSALDIHGGDYPHFSGMYYRSDATQTKNDDAPPCLQAYAGELAKIAYGYRLKSWYAIPVNAPSQTGIYNVAQIFIGLKKQIDVSEDGDDSKQLASLIKDLISLFHYLSHWRSNDIAVVKELLSQGSTQQGNDPGNDLSLSEDPQSEDDYFQSRLSLFLKQFRNLLLARIVVMPSQNSDLTYAYNYTLSVPDSSHRTSDGLEEGFKEVLEQFNNARKQAAKNGHSLSKAAKSHPFCSAGKEEQEFTTDLIPVPGKCHCEQCPRENESQNGNSEDWATSWAEWCSLRGSGSDNHNPNATMLFLPIGDAAGDNETYVYAEFLGRKDDIKEQLDIFTKSMSSIVKKSIAVLRLYEDLRVKAISTAIGSIMSRNGSHNIGSHVLSALSHRIGTMPDDRVLYQYLQQRMDYTATVTTDFPNWTAPTRFVGNLMKTFFSQRHLLEHISESEGLGAYHFRGRHLPAVQEAKIKIHLRKFEYTEVNPQKIWAQAYSTPTGSQNGRLGAPMWKEFTDYGENTGKPESLLKDDIAVAIPGGVVGQHAFYTIVENIIRNAAKHEWASIDRDHDNDNDNQGHGVDNLEIYIDFVDLRQEAKVEFTIWSSGGKSEPIEREEIEPLSADAVRKMVKLLNENKGSSPKSENEGESSKKTQKRIEEHPLHQRLQVRLAQQLITKKGSPRRENWGLAEMKISAGYLQRRSIGLIGGLTDLKDGDHIILPVAVPDAVQTGRYHLGYRFSIPASKKILIVTIEDSQRQNEAAFIKEGIYFKSVEAIKRTEKNENGDIELAYEYVVLPAFPKYEKEGQNVIDFTEWLLPFRVLAGRTDDAQKYCTIGYDELIKKTDPAEIKNAVYTEWLTGLKEKCLEREERKNQLYLQVQAEGSSGGGQGLVSDRDLYGVMFHECGHSIMMEATRHQKDKTAQRLTALLALMPMGEKDRMQFPNGNGIDSGDYIRDRLRDFCDRFKRELSLSDAFVQMVRKIYYDATTEVAGKKLSPFEESFLRNVQLDLLNGSAFTKSRVGDLLRYLAETSPGKLSAALDAFSGGEKALFYDSEHDPDDIYGCDEEQLLLQKNIARLFGSTELSEEFSELIDKLNSAYLTSDVFLRKYEENISTLPSFYKEQPKEDDTAAARNSPFKIVQPWTSDADGNGTVIRYLRHDNTQKGHYVEALSGSQSYLNALINFDWSRPELITRVTENALLRVLIIDERVYNFLKVRPLELEACRKMHIYAVDIEKSNQFFFPDRGFVTVVKPDKGQNGVPKEEEIEKGFQIPAGKFDILIIHQGIIDKWVNAHDDKTVGRLLDAFEERIPYVVVTTGRGRPDNIPDYARVLPFSSIESTLFRKYPEKLVLVNTVMNIHPAKPRKDGNQQNNQQSGAGS